MPRVRLEHDRPVPQRHHPVLEMQLQAREPLAGDEREASITLDASQPLPLDEVLGRIDWGNAE